MHVHTYAQICMWTPLDSLAGVEELVVQVYRLPHSKFCFSQKENSNNCVWVVGAGLTLHEELLDAGERYRLELNSARG